MRDGLITVIFNDCATYPEIELLLTLNSLSFIKGSVCLSSFVGIGSSKHIDDLDE